MSAKNWKQRILDDYLNQSGANAFVPAEFLAWLRERPDHECFSLFFGMSDAEAAQAHREELVRKWVSGLRIVVRAEEVSTRKIGAVEVREYSLPLVHSPVDVRRDGGGYLHTDPNDQAHLAEIARQGAVALTAWVERYKGAANLLGVDISGVDLIRSLLDAAADRADPPRKEPAAA